MILKRLLIGIAVLTLSKSAGIAQSYPYNFDTRPLRGFMPNSDQIASPVDNIDQVNGKLHLEIPLASLPKGRGGSQFDVNLVYDSHLYDMLPSNTGGQMPGTVQRLSNLLTTGGWTYSVTNYRLELEYRLNPGSCGFNGQRMFRLRIGLPDGSWHVLHLKGYGAEVNDGYTAGDGFYAFTPDGTRDGFACNPSYPGPMLPGRLTYYTSDGTYLKLEIDADGTDWTQKVWVLYSPDGRRVVGTGNAAGTANEAIGTIDANGNTFLFYNYCVDFPTCNQPETGIEDAFNRWVILEYNVTNSNKSTDTQMQDQIFGPGVGGSVQWNVNWEVVTLGINTTRQYDCGQDTVPNLCNLRFRHWVVQNVQLPAPVPATPPGPYQFGYSDDSVDGYGELNFMQTPSGAQYRYNYSLEGPLSNQPATRDILSYNSLTQKTISHDGLSEDYKWTYGFGDNVSSVTDTRTNAVTTNYFYDRRSDSATPAWASGLVYRIENSLGSVTDRSWSQNIVYGLTNTTINPNNPFISIEGETVGNAAAQPSETATKVFTYDKNGNLTSRTEQDWQLYVACPNPLMPPCPIPSSGSVLRQTQSSYYVTTPDASVITDAAGTYWQTTIGDSVPERLDAVTRRETCQGVCNSSYTTTKAVTEYQYDNALQNGNPTMEFRWDNQKPMAPPPAPGLTGSNAQVLTRAYDSSGNLTDILAPEVRTKFTYDAVSGFPAPGPYPTRIDYAYGSTVQRSWTYAWDTPSGAVTTKTDLDNNIPTYFYYDSVGRATLVNEDYARSTATSYDDQYLTITVKRDLAAYGDGKLQTISSYDQLGRASQKQNVDGFGGIYVKTNYVLDSAGRRAVVTSTPYRNTSDVTLEWTCTQYDRLGRTITVAQFNGSSAPTDCQSTTNRTGATTRAYDRNKVSVTDGAGVTRDEYRDPLGRLIDVYEDPQDSMVNYHTNYTYDALDNLVQVSQDPSQPARTFVYSSLSRLISAFNPESATTSYTYDDGGTLHSKADARGATVTYGYDTLQRLVSKTYTNDGGLTPAVQYNYFGSGSASPNVGRLESVLSTAGSKGYANYDVLGRFHTSAQVIGGNATLYQLSYDYWLNDELKQVQYPSGTTINYDVGDIYDVGHVNKVSTSTTVYADLTPIVVGPFQYSSYTPDGRILHMKLGNSLWESHDYRTPDATNPTKFQLGTMHDFGDFLEYDYFYSPTANNGNLQTQVISSGSSFVRTQSYTYDALNRLSNFTETGGDTGLTQTFGYDRFGNRWVQAASGLHGVDIHEPTVQTNFEVTTNRLKNLMGSAFDAAGNQTTYAPYTLAYDAEARNVSVTSSGGNGAFAYDGDGRRVEKVWTPGGGSATATYYIYNDVTNQVVSEYSSAPAGSPGVWYPFTDMLGSVRAVTDQSGAVVECYDYLPFGRMLRTDDDSRDLGCYPANPDSQLTSVLPQKFTGKERDVETGLDNFGARYLSAAQGRFTSPDPGNAGAIPGDPQSWNGYAYARNNPFLYTDPTGEAYVICDEEGKKCSTPQEFLPRDKDVLYKNGGVFAINGDGSTTRVGKYYETGDYQDATAGLLLFASLARSAAAGAVGLLEGFVGSGVRQTTVEAATSTTAQVATSTAKSEVQTILSKAGSTVGNQSIRVGSREAAEQAAKEWVGSGARQIVDRNTGAPTGWISADGARVARFTSANNAEPYINLQNKVTGGNLHVRF
jgi:RHS repeat-associated protein